ncbi:MAG: hypothetical protein PHO01_11075 [Desulfotomaculaceae bacterium]|nr:hypothetical protein [Desulfotomaculaceae bacterium]
MATRHLKLRVRAIFRRAQALEKIAQNQFSRQSKITGGYPSPGAWLAPSIG